MSTTEAAEHWRDICMKAFDGQQSYSDFILWFEGCPVKNNDMYRWTADNDFFEKQLKATGCREITQDSKQVHTLAVEEMENLISIKRQARTQWHSNRQDQLKSVLYTCLKKYSSPLNISQDQRIALVAEFATEHNDNVGSLPFIRGIVGLLKYQLQYKDHVAEWKANEHVFTQNGEEALESYIRLLICILGLQLKYKDNEEQVSDLVINIENIIADQDNTPKLTWLMNPELDSFEINEILRRLPKGSNTEGYSLSIQRRHDIGVAQNMFKWIFAVIAHCFKILHR